MNVARETRALRDHPRVPLRECQLVLQLSHLVLCVRERSHQPLPLGGVAQQLQVTPRDAERKDAADDRPEHVRVARVAVVQNRRDDHDGEHYA